MSLLADPRVRSVEWRDLANLSRFESIKELAMPLPWLAGSLALAAYGLWVPALACSFLFFLAGLRLVHDAFHYNLGLSRRATEWVIFALSLAMLGSMHAVQFNHLRHHKHCLDEEDVEARSAHMSGLRAVLWGPVFPVLLHRTALAHATQARRWWIVSELSATLAWVVAVSTLLPFPVLRYHVAAMLVGHCLTAFFAVWTVHHDCDPSREIARTMRNRFKSAIAMNMFFHVEHHLFPRVPTCRLPRLAKRLDRVAPEVGEKRVY